jgi:hypothetical protein
MALSFASPAGCAEIWDYIEDIRRFYLHDGHGSPLATSTPSGSPTRQNQPEAFLQMFAHGQLPDPTLANLTDLDKLVKWASRTPLGREKLAALAIRSVRGDVGSSRGPPDLPAGLYPEADTDHGRGRGS